MALAMELRGHVVKAFRCPHANYVLQKCIALMSPENSQFIIDELLERSGMVAHAAKHRYGCRIMQQLLRNCLPSQVKGIVELLLDDVMAFSCHAFGNFVMQHVLEQGADEQKHRLTRILECNVPELCKSTAGCNVISSALLHGAREDRMRLACAISQEPGLLEALHHVRSGDAVVTLVMEVVRNGELEHGGKSPSLDFAGVCASSFGQYMVQPVSSEEDTRFSGGVSTP